MTAQLLALESRYTVAGTRCEFVTIDSSSSIPAELGRQCLFELICRDEDLIDEGCLGPAKYSGDRPQATAGGL